MKNVCMLEQRSINIPSPGRRPRRPNNPRMRSGVVRATSRSLANTRPLGACISLVATATGVNEHAEFVRFDGEFSVSSPLVVDKWVVLCVIERASI